MPLYVYRCGKCGACTDVFVLSITNENKNPTMCLPCWLPMKRIPTIPAIRGETVVKRQL